MLNPTVEVVPMAADRFLLRAPLWGQRLDATRYQVGLLQQFEQPATRDGVLEAYPFHKKESEAFLDACIAEGLLFLCDADGKPRLPATSRATPSFCNAPPFDPTAPSAFVALGVPFDANTTGLAGAKFGPSAMRQASEGIRYRVDPLSFEPIGFHDFASGRTLLKGITLSDAGDVFMSPGEGPDKAYDRITDVTRDVVESGAIPLIMGGDHSITYPVLRAFPTSRLGIIHLDAHTDLGEPLPGGGLHHGNVFSFVLERMEFVEHITQIGLRGVLDASEYAASDLVTAIGMDQFRARKIESIIDLIPADIAYYLSVDIDVVDPAFAPSTGTPVSNGMYPHELKSFLHAVAQARNIIGMDVVEVAQPGSTADQTASIGVECLLTVADGIVKGLQHKLSDADTHEPGDLS